MSSWTVWMESPISRRGRSAVNELGKGARDAANIHLIIMAKVSENTFA